MIKTSFVFLYGFSLLCIITSSGCQRKGPSPRSAIKPYENTSAKLSDRELIRRSFFLGVIQELSNNAKGPLFFLVLEPGEEKYIREFYNGFEARPASYCVIKPRTGGQGEEGEVKEKGTGRRGVLVEIKEIEINGTTAEVYGGYFSGASVMYSFRLR